MIARFQIHITYKYDFRDLKSDGKDFHVQKIAWFSIYFIANFVVNLFEMMSPKGF